MQTFPLNALVSIAVPLVDNNGATVVPVALSYTLSDGAGNVLDGPNDIIGNYTDGDSVATILISSTFSQTLGPRVIDLTITVGDDGATFAQEAIYAISVNSGQRLVFLQNSFQSMAQALYLANDLVAVDAFNAADSSLQVPALMEAFGRLTRMNYVIPYPEMVDVQSIYAPEYYADITPRMWQEMTPTLYALYPSTFTSAVCKAQVLEANDILTGDPIGDKIRSGLFSEKIGQSSMMFRSGISPLKTPVCRPAMAVLSGFINNRVVTTRS